MTSPAATLPLVDLGALWREIGAEAEAAAVRVMRSGQFILGPDVERFEQAFAAYCGCSHAVGVASGLDALKLGLRAAGVRPGDEVILPAHTFIATALAVIAIGAVPVLVDVDEDSMNLDASLIAAALTPRTRAIVPVHLYGRPADMTAVLEAAAARRIAVIEDASQAHGARHRGRRTGSMGALGAFSLYPAKNLGALGDAGVITTCDAGMAETLRVLRNYGSRSKNVHEALGENSRLDTLHAAVLVVKLRRLDAWNAARARAARAYGEALRGIGDLRLPSEAPGDEHSHHLYVVRSGRRDALLRHLQERGIGAAIHYPVPVHLHPATAALGWRTGQFPAAEAIARSVLSLPMFPQLTDAQIDSVAAEARAFFG